MPWIWQANKKGIIEVRDVKPCTGWREYNEGFGMSGPKKDKPVVFKKTETFDTKNEAIDALAQYHKVRIEKLEQDLVASRKTHASLWRMRDQ